MKVRVRFFAVLREAAGIAEVSLEVPEQATAEDAWTTLASTHKALVPHRKSLGLAVNRAYAPFSRILGEGDEIVFIPPVSGG
jgi:molybdopterin converting factor subunit 1